MRVAISRAHFPIHTLGPGSRLGIWFQGCSIRCKGCISLDTWANATPDLEVVDFLRQIHAWIDACDGITISGGEPFDQPEALICMLSEIKRLREVDVLVYSGHPLEAISKVLECGDNLIDAVISDPFQILMPQTLALRGSDNQRLTLLTPLGETRFKSFERSRDASDDRLNLMMDGEGSAWMVGIPKRGDLSRLRNILREDGNNCRTTEDPMSTRANPP